MNLILSQPLQPPSATAGSPGAFEVPWDAFVRLVLDLAVEAYEAMRQAHVAQSGWDEDVFSLNLTEFMVPRGLRRSPALMVHFKTHEFSQAMYSGAKSIKKSKEIDIRVVGTWQGYNKLYFALECKLVAIWPKGKKGRNLQYDYIKDGIMRFVGDQYSGEVSDAGMLGYVLSGDVSEIVKKINLKMVSGRNRQYFTTADKLVPNNSIRGHNDVYISKHIRPINRSTINLHHIFLTF